MSRISLFLLLLFLSLSLSLALSPFFPWISVGMQASRTTPDRDAPASATLPSMLSPSSSHSPRTEEPQLACSAAVIDSPLADVDQVRADSLLLASAVSSPTDAQHIFALVASNDEHCLRSVLHYFRHELPALTTANAHRPRPLAALAIESRNPFCRLNTLPTLGPLQMIEQYV